MHSFARVDGKKEKKKERTRKSSLSVCLPAHLPRHGEGVCCKSSVTDLKSGFLPINIDPSKPRTLPLLLFFHTARVRRPQPCFHFPLWPGYFIQCACRRAEQAKEEVGGGGGTDDGGSRKTLEMRVFHYFISNDVGRDGYRREGKRDRR